MKTGRALIDIFKPLLRDSQKSYRPTGLKKTCNDFGFIICKQKKNNRI